MRDTMPASPPNFNFLLLLLSLWGISRAWLCSFSCWALAAASMRWSKIGELLVETVSYSVEHGTCWHHA
jgi:hypothetical protein